jgi:hypothetical protein
MAHTGLNMELKKTESKVELQFNKDIAVFGEKKYYLCPKITYSLTLNMNIVLTITVSR